MSDSSVLWRRRTDSSAARRLVVKVGLSSPPTDGCKCSYVDEVPVEFVDKVGQVEYFSRADPRVH